MSEKGRLEDGVACGHPGCLNHVTHPCEGCGRVAGMSRPWAKMESMQVVTVDEGIEIRIVFDNGRAYAATILHPRAADDVAGALMRLAQMIGRDPMLRPSRGSRD